MKVSISDSSRSACMGARASLEEEPALTDVEGAMAWLRGLEEGDSGWLLRAIASGS